MFGTLVKKQLYEVFKGYFYDAKKNKARSKGAVIAWFLFFIVIMAGVIGGMFTFLSLTLCDAFAKEGLSWFYFVLMGLIAIMLGVFGSVFNTYAGLYCAKDNDLLLSMPIPQRYIMAARLLNVYLMGLMYSSIVILPAIIVYLVVTECGILPILGGVVFIIEISVICFVLSCILGWCVARISLKLKHKNIVTVFASLFFICAYYFLYFKATDFVKTLILNVTIYGAAVKGKAYPLYIWGKTSEGDGYAILIGLIVTIALLVFTWILMSRSFLKMATSTGVVSRRVYKEKRAKKHGISYALLTKEFGRFTGSANYMLNCGLGILVMPITGIIIILKGNMVMDLVKEVMGSDVSILTIALPALVCMMASMNDMAAPSVSLEGKSLWLSQSLPVEPWHILRAKLNVQLILTEIPALFCAVCAATIIPGTIVEKILGLGIVVCGVLLQALWCLFCGIKMPNLSWTNEIAPIKQSLSVVLAIVGGFVYGAVYAGMYLYKGNLLGVMWYEIIGIVITLILSLILYQNLKTKGAKQFANL